MGVERGEGAIGYIVYTYVTWGLFCRAVERSDFEGVEAFMWVSNSPGLFTFYLKVFYMGSLVES